LITLYLFIFRSARLLLSILTLSLSAKYFGINIERDVWIIGFTFISTIQLAIWGPLDDTFRSKYISIRELEGVEKSTKRTVSLISFSLIVSLFIVFIIILFSLPISKTIAPSFDSKSLIKLSFLIKILSPSFLLTQLSKIWTSILNAHDIYYIPEIAGFISSAISLLIMIKLAPLYGIFSLVISTYTALFLLLVFLFFSLKKLKLDFLRISFFEIWKNSKIFILFTLPFFVPFFFGQINNIFEKILANKIGIGIVSIIDYSRKFSDIPLMVLLGVLTTLMVPKITKNYILGNHNEYIFEIKKNLQLAFIIITILVSFITSSSYRLTEFLYFRGNMSQIAVNKISILSILYSWAIIPVFIYSILGLSLLSLGKEKVYATMGFLSQILMILFNICFYQKLNIYTFTISLFMAHLIAASFMFFRFDYGKKIIIKSLIKYFSILIFVSLFMLFYNQNFEQPINIYFYLLSHLFIILIIILCILFVFKLDESKKIIQILKF